MADGKLLIRANFPALSAAFWSDSQSENLSP
jgi:hypothetical protein